MVTLTCGLPPAYPAPRVVAWLLNDEPVAASGNIMFSNDMLTFTSVSADQTGLWVCRAENDAGMRSSQPTLINVQGEGVRLGMVWGCEAGMVWGTLHEPV